MTISGDNNDSTKCYFGFQGSGAGYGYNLTYESHDPRTRILFRAPVQTYERGKHKIVRGARKGLL